MTQVKETTISNRKATWLPKAPGISWAALGFLWVIFAFNGAGRELLNRVSPLIVSEYGITASTWGNIASLIAIATGFLAIIGGIWSDKIGRGWARKKSNIWVILGYTIFLLVIGISFISVSIGLFVLFYVLRNAASGVGESIEVASMAEWWPAESRGFALGVHHTAYPWGTLLSGFLVTGILLATNNDWRMIFLILPPLVIPVLIGYWFFATPNRFRNYERKTIEMGLTPTVNEEYEEIQQADKKGAFKAILKNPNVMVVTFISFLAMAGYIGIGFWLTPYLTYVAEFDITKAATYSVIFTITGGIGQIVWGSLSDKFGRKASLLFNFAWLTVGFLLLPFTANGLLWLVLIQLFIGLSTNAVYPVLYAYVSDSAKKGYMSTALGIQLTGLFLGGLSPMFLGYFINLGGGWESHSGYQVGIYILAGFMALAFLMTLLFTHETVGKKRGKDFALVSYESCGIEKNK